MRATIVELVGKTGHHAGDGRAHQNGKRSCQAQDNCPAHLARLDLLAQELGRAADHKAGDEHCEDGEAIMPYRPQPTPPKTTSPRAIWSIWTNPPSGV